MYLRLAIAAVVAVLLAGTHWKAYKAGEHTVQAAWDAAKLEAENQAESLRLLRQSQVNKAAKGFAEKAARDRVIVQKQIVEVEKYVPNTLPMLPGDFRLYYDAAVTGEEIDLAKRADASPVAPRNLAENAATNYAAARYDQSRLEALQEIVRASGCFDVEE